MPSLVDISASFGARCPLEFSLFYTLVLQLLKVKIVEVNKDLFSDPMYMV